MKKGFKQTEIGMIPEDWEVEYLGKLGTFLKGKGISKSEALTGELPAVRYGELYTKHNNLIKHFYSFVNEDVAKNSFKLQYGDQLFAGSGETKEEIGKSAAFIGNEEVYAGGDIVVFRPKEKDNPVFFGFLFNSTFIQSQKAMFGQGDAVVHIYARNLKNLLIPLPPKPEQSAIAQVLSDTDALIESLENLIAKKQALKQGAMQELLTGRRRLRSASGKPFEGEWEEKTLNEISENLVRGPFGGALKKEFFVNEGYKVYEQKNAIKKDLYLGNYFIDEKRFKELKRFEVNQDDFIVSCSGTIGEILRIPQKHPRGIINQALLKITIASEVINKDFFLHLFRSQPFQNKIIDDTQGGAMKNLVGMNVFKETKLFIPSLEEQTAIAQVLSDMDAEIEGLEARLHKTRQLKQGLMQALLTGRIRLDVNQFNHQESLGMVAEEGEGYK